MVNNENIRFRVSLKKYGYNLERECLTIEKY
jgi:hypothetical protein